MLPVSYHASDPLSPDSSPRPNLGPYSCFPPIQASQRLFTFLTHLKRNGLTYTTFCLDSSCTSKGSRLHGPGTPIFQPGVSEHGPRKDGPPPSPAHTWRMPSNCAERGSRPGSEFWFTPTCRIPILSRCVNPVMLRKVGHG